MKNTSIFSEEKHTIKKPELLAPAGDLERLKWAIHYGADAVYLGGSLYGLRANATNFTLEEMSEGIKYAHQFQKKVYVTVNIALHQKDIEPLISYLKELEKREVDAIIVSDPIVLELALKHTKLMVHLSTQQSTLNYEAVSFWKNCGVSRIVLGRETTKEEMQSIRDHVDIELECFIHGAMCASYSGRCVLSNFLTARDSNRGGCSQICRWDFHLQEEDGQLLEGEKPFTFCTKDLSLYAHLPELIQLGITSFKIEGRMRSIYYIATVVNIYRKAIDRYFTDPSKNIYQKEEENALFQVSNRDSIAQFFDGREGKECQYYNGRMESSNQDFLGVILSYDPDTHLALVEQRNYFENGDMVELISPKAEPISLPITDLQNSKGEKIDAARHPQEIVKVKIDFPVYPMDMIRKKIS